MKLAEVEVTRDLTWGKELPEQLIVRDGKLTMIDGGAEARWARDNRPAGRPEARVVEAGKPIEVAIEDAKNKRTMAGLFKGLRQEIKEGRFVGYRLITIRGQSIGIPDEKPRKRFRKNLNQK
jgi:hypothetical protein